MSPNRIVVLLTPFAAVAAGAAATWLADHVPGADVTAGQLEAVFVAGLAAVVAPAAQWLHGSQKYERHQQDLEQAAIESGFSAGDRCEACGSGHADEGEAYGDRYVDEEYAAALGEAEPAFPLGG